MREEQTFRAKTMHCASERATIITAVRMRIGPMKQHAKILAQGRTNFSAGCPHPGEKSQNPG